MRMRSVVGALVLAVAATAPVAAQQVSAAALAKLEQERTRRPTHVGTLRALGVAYYKNARYQDARTVLQQARAADQRDGVVALYLGMSAERLNDITAAKNAYTSYLAVGRSGKAKNEVTARLAAISRQELVAVAKDAVAREQQLAQRPGPANTIAVLPLSFEGADAGLAPLGRGLADLMVSDLSLVNSLSLVERGRVQALIDEITLGQTGRVDQATAARSGRMLQAGRLVLGRITQTGTGLTVTAPTVTVTNGQQGARPTTVNGSLSRIFDMQKELVFGVLADLGVTLTPQQREAINRRPTQNVQAFLAYSRGLLASDAGRLQEAANFFDNARSLDPAFGVAAARAVDARAALQGQQVTPATIEAGLQGSEVQVVSAAERGAVASGRDALGTTLGNAIADVNPSAADGLTRATSQAATRDPVSATTGGESSVRTTGSVIIVIRRP